MVSYFEYIDVTHETAGDDRLDLPVLRVTGQECRETTTLDDDHNAGLVGRGILDIFERPNYPHSRVPDPQNVSGTHLVDGPRHPSSHLQDVRMPR